MLGEIKMPRYKQSLTVEFNTPDDAPLYSGICYYRKNLSDNIEIRRSGIVVNFERSKKDKPGELLNTQNSIIRYYLQKALCFYLAVGGCIPKVNAITFTCNDKTVPIEHESFTHHWEDCRVDICLDPKAAGIIFESDKGKPFYIMMTHFLKAQLDNFSHDRFRSAWSSLNCLYTYIDALDNEGYRSEEKKLTTLANTMTDNTMPDSIKRVESLDTETFWKKLNWYNVFNSYSNKEFNRVVSGAYKDSFLIGLICHYRDVFKAEIKSNDNDWKKIEEKAEKNISAPKDRLKFLICKYCYHVRNKSFHAEKAYPLFIISEDAETRIEKELTQIILLTIKDLFDVYTAKARE